MYLTNKIEKHLRCFTLTNDTMFFILMKYLFVPSVILDIEMGITPDEYQWAFRIPDYFSSPEDLDKLV